MVGGDSAALFPSLGVPRAQADETLYSWCARVHRLSGNVDPRDTSRQLFGHATAGLRPEFPTNLEFFSKVTGYALGSLAEVIHDRTHFALFAPFLDADKCATVAEGMRIREKAKAVQRLGLTRAGIDLDPPLRLCAACLEVDRESVPTGWWRSEHQWLPMRVCLHHRQYLTEIHVPRTRHGASDWYLPTRLSQEIIQPRPIDETQLEAFSRIAHWTKRLIEEKNLLLTGTCLRSTYLLQAMKNGWIALDGSLRFAQIKDAFLERYRSLRGIPGMVFLEEAEELNGGFIGLAFRQYPGQRHPIKHIYLMAFLFETESEFLAMYKKTSAVLDEDGEQGVQNMLKKTQTDLLSQITVDGVSVNAASISLGVAPTQSIRLLKKLGVSYGCRPRVLTSQLKKKLDKMLRAGDDREVIATSLNIRKAFIKDYLANHKNLRTAWDQAHATRVTNRYREHFQRVLEDNPGVPIKRIRRISGNGFEWLYRKDRKWLETQLPAIWQRPK